MTRFTSTLRTFRKTQSGNASIEFVILFPVIMALFFTGFEAGYYMVRNVMLERAVDLSMRQVRLGGAIPTSNKLKGLICNEASLGFDDCVNNMRIEMREVDNTPGDIAAKFGQDALCVDKFSTEDDEDFTNFEVGTENKVMIVRVCALAQPLFPTTGIGVGMGMDAEGNLAMVASTAFVAEPGNRALDVTVPDPSTGSGT